MNKNGFTLVELLVAISILAILTALAIPTLRAFQDSNSKTQYITYKKSLNTSGKLYNDSYSEDLFGNALFGCQKVDLTELIYKRLAKDIELNDVSCNISTKDSFVIVKKYDNEFKYQSSLYCENSKHVEQYSDKENIISDCINDTGVPWIDIESINNTDKNSKNKSVIIKLLDNYGFTAKQVVNYAWSTSESAPAASSSIWKKYGYNNQVKKTTGGTVILKSNSITIPESSTGYYYLYVKPIKVQNILNQSFTEIKKYGPFRFDHTAPKCNQITVTPNISVNSYSKEVKFDISYVSSLDDLKSYDFLISYDDGVHWTTVKKNADKSYTSYTVDKDGDIRYRLVNLVDYAGNETSECAKSGVFHRDNNPPTCTIGVVGTKSGTSGYYYVTTRASVNSGEIADLTFGIKTKESKEYNNIRDIMIDTDGNSNIYGYVKDKAGNEGSCNKSITTTKKYTITFNGNGGTANPTTKKVYWGDRISSLATASRKGYTFNGWYTASTNGSKISADAIMPRKNITYYARWNPKSVTVTFDCNGGEGGGTETFTYDKTGQKFSKTCTLSKYNLEGWKKDKNATSIDYDVNNAVTGNWVLTHTPKIKLYAHWQIKNYMIEMNDKKYYYTTLADAVAAAKSGKGSTEGGTITVLQNVIDYSKVEISKNITIKINKNVTLTKKKETIYIKKNGIVNIIGEGNLYAEDLELIYNEGHLTLNHSGKIQHTLTKSTNYEYAAIDNINVMIVNNANIISKVHGITTQSRLSGITAKTIINGGNIKSSGKLCTLLINKGAMLTMNGGTITNTYWDTVAIGNYAGSTSINGGTIINTATNQWATIHNGPPRHPEGYDINECGSLTISTSAVIKSKTIKLSTNNMVNNTHYCVLVGGNCSYKYNGKTINYTNLNQGVVCKSI